VQPLLLLSEAQNNSLQEAVEKVAANLPVQVQKGPLPGICCYLNGEPFRVGHVHNAGSPRHDLSLVAEG
jgi:hypothetical protein